MYVLAGLLAIGLFANARIATRTSWIAAKTTTAPIDEGPPPIARLAALWIVVLIPMAWGIAQVVNKSTALFR